MRNVGIYLVSLRRYDFGFMRIEEVWKCNFGCQAWFAVIIAIFCLLLNVGHTFSQFFTFK